MSKIYALLIMLFSLFALSGCQPNKSFSEDEIALIPQVKTKVTGSSSFKIRKSTKFVVESIEQQEVARYFSELFANASGWKPEIIIGGDHGTNQVIFSEEPAMAPEAYSIEVTTKRIEIKAAQPAGFFYAIQTLRQLLPPEIEKNFFQENMEWLVPVIQISDSPAFAWRGFMLDVVRHFFPKEDLFRIIDYLAIHKINTLHLHLVDDQGWRIEIKKYPKLTEIGSWRVDHESLPWNSRPAQQAGEKASYGGFYSQNDIKEIIAYAERRFITVVPEIEMPAHVASALAAYPKYSCSGGPFTVPSGGVWPITDIYCAGNDSTFLFLEDILSEVTELFPSKYIHIGGDEATKTEWEKCPKCRKRIKSEGLKDVVELQSYFIKRIEKFVHSKGKILLGWDEILEGGLPPEATVMSWRGIQGGIEAARQGHDVVMSPNSHVYFDYYQGPSESEPLAIGGYLPLQKVYSFYPVPEELDSEAAKHILGGQANLWTEYIPDLKHAEYMMFPRIAALSEVLWSPKKNQSWSDFSHRIQKLMKRYELMGINYSKSSFKVTAKSQSDPEKNELAISLHSELDGAEIHFTTNGTEPTVYSERYTEPFVLDQSTIVKAVTFQNGHPATEPFTQLFNTNKATAKKVSYIKPFNKLYPGSGDYTLVNAFRGSSNHSDGEWQGWLGNDMEVIIDLDDSTEIQNISVGALQSTGAYIFLPTQVDFSISPDGIKFEKLANAFNYEAPMAEEKTQKDFSAFFHPVSTRYVKIVAHNLGKCPKGHSGAGQPAWMFIDEIKIE